MSERTESIMRQFAEHARSLGLVRVKLDGMYATAYVPDTKDRRRSVGKLELLVLSDSTTIRAMPMVMTDPARYLNIEGFLQVDQAYIDALQADLVHFDREYRRTQTQMARLREQQFALRTQFEQPPERHIDVIFANGKPIT